MANNDSKRIYNENGRNQYERVIKEKSPKEIIDQQQQEIDSLKAQIVALKDEYDRNLQEGYEEAYQMMLTMKNKINQLKAEIANSTSIDDQNILRRACSIAEEEKKSVDSQIIKEKAKLKKLEELKLQVMKENGGSWSTGIPANKKVIKKVVNEDHVKYSVSLDPMY